MTKINKKAGLLSVVFLTFLTLTLVTLTLVAFNLRGQEIVKLTLADLQVLYIKEDLVNFYVGSIINQIILENPGITASEFTTKFQQSLELYKNEGYYVLPELIQIEGQLANLKIEDEQLIFPLTIRIEGYEEGIYASYTYTKTFGGSIEEGAANGGILTAEEAVQESIAYSKTFSLGEISFFSILKTEGINQILEEHSIKVMGIDEKGATFLITSSPLEARLDVGEKKKLDLNNDGYYDIYMHLISAEPLTGEIAADTQEIHEPVYYNSLETNSYFIGELIESQRTDEIQLLARYSVNEEFRQAGEDNNYISYWEALKSEPVSYISGQNEPSSLPWRPVYSSYELFSSEGLEEYSEGSFGVPCGPAALHRAFSDLGVDADIRELIQEKQGGLARNFLSIFDKDASHITWPKEIASISRKYGLEVEQIKGRKATLDTAAAKSTDNSVVIARIKTEDKVLGFINQEHYTVYDTNQALATGTHAYSDFSDINSPIQELYILRKAA